MADVTTTDEMFDRIPVAHRFVPGAGSKEADCGVSKDGQVIIQGYLFNPDDFLRFGTWVAKKLGLPMPG